MARHANNRRAIGRSFETDLLSIHHASPADPARARYWDDWGWQPRAHPDICVECRLGSQQRSCPAAFRKASQGKSFGVGSSEALPASEKGSEPRIKRLNKIQEDISAMNSGAFAGYLNNPILGALSLPVMGTIIALAIEFLTNS